MILIEDFLPQQKRIELKALLASIDYQDGGLTAGRVGSQVKRSLECNTSHPNYAKANDIICRSLTECQALERYGFPHKVTPVLFAKYLAGMKYGNHYDSVLIPIPGGGRLRTDLSFTVFLSSPDDYDGGELVISAMGVEIQVKPKAGDLYVYPSALRHRVNEVTKGCREVAVGWIQSLYAAPEQRQVLSDLSVVSRWILNTQGKTEEFDLLNGVGTQLRRIWANPTG
jgi:PKHD-type hydroxylase